MAATDLNTLKTNISTTINNSVPSITGDMVGGSDVDVVDSVNQNTGGVYKYTDNPALTQGKFTMTLIDGLTITDRYDLCGYIAIRDEDLGGLNFSSLANPAFAIQLFILNNDGTKVTFECTPDSYASNIIAFEVTTNHYTDPTTILLDDVCKLEIVAFDSSTFSPGLQDVLDKDSDATLTSDLNVNGNNAYNQTFINGELFVTRAHGVAVFKDNTVIPGIDILNSMGYFDTNSNFAGVNVRGKDGDDVNSANGNWTELYKGSFDRTESNSRFVVGKYSDLSKQFAEMAIYNAAGDRVRIVFDEDSSAVMYDTIFSEGLNYATPMTNGKSEHGERHIPDLGTVWDGGETAGRPSTPLDFEQYFDTDLGTNGKPIWYNGSDWVDANDTIV